MKLPESYHNLTSYTGTIISIVSVIMILFLFLVTSVFDGGGSYSGLLLYMALPAMLIVGLLLIPVGMFLRFRKLNRFGAVVKKKKMVIDFNNLKHKNAVIIFFLGSIVFLMLTSIGSYEAFHYTESNVFCGTLCHEVMEPEYTTYQTSAHARVKCVECHVGAGANWYVKSKLSGLYQTYAVLADVYPRPIPTPITSLRPARETCEQCHWPQKFYSNRIKNEIHYLADSSNTKWDISYKMKIGPSHSSLGNSEGIHWHVNNNVRIQYINSTPDREFIPWVKYVNLDTNDTLIYHSTEEPLDSNTIHTSTVSTMDCMDCHNRPSHQFLSPQDFIDHAIAKGEISSDIPEIKYIAMQLLRNSFSDIDTANLIIHTTITDFYEEKYLAFYQKNINLINQSIDGIQKAYAENTFPKMGANWDSYPNHIGHVEYNGCFRCHDDKHVSSDGKVIRKDCNLCHSILHQGTSENSLATTFNQSLEFKHPTDIDEAWKEYLCADCHRYLY